MKRYFGEASQFTATLYLYSPIPLPAPPSRPHSLSLFFPLSYLRGMSLYLQLNVFRKAQGEA